MKELAVVIGRFQPYHYGHADLIHHASSLAKRVLVLVGSANSHLSPKNPFTFETRKGFIQGCSLLNNNAIRVEPLNDYPYCDQTWIKEVQRQIHKYTPGDSVVIVGHKKDNSSYYLDLFPQYEYHDFCMKEEIHATDIRKSMFEGETTFENSVPLYTQKFLSYYLTTKKFKELQKEHYDLVKYKLSFSSLPYPPIFVTCDAVVVCGGHVAMVKRKFSPGKGTWAMPGGFIDENERVVDGIMRELKEETRIDVPPAIIRNSIKDISVFDDPGRSLRGRTITHAGLIVLKEKTLPKMIPADDAEEAEWISFDKLDELVKDNKVFEDHYHIIVEQIKKIK